MTFFKIIILVTLTMVFIYYGVKYGQDEREKVLQKKLDDI